MAVTSAVLSTFDAIRGYAGSVSWGPLVTFSRNQVLSLLRRIEIGQIVVTDRNGAVIICGSPAPKDGSPKTELKVHKEAFWMRLLLFADMVRLIKLVPCSIHGLQGN